MRNVYVLAFGVMLALPTPLLAQGDQVVMGPEPGWVTALEPADVPADVSGPLFVRKQYSQVHLEADGQSTYIAQHFKILNSRALEIGNLALVWNPASGSPTIHAVHTPPAAISSRMSP